jgi:hypothetical protein
VTTEEVRHRVDEIWESVNDDEHAHGLEDDLWQDVLRAIAAGAPNAAELATEALKTTDIEFARWCA